jgi:hypothetical protein
LVIKKEVARRMLAFLEFVEVNSTDGLEKTPTGYNKKVDSLYWKVKELNRKGRDLPEEEFDTCCRLVQSKQERAR